MWLDQQANTVAIDSFLKANCPSNASPEITSRIGRNCISSYRSIPWRSFYFLKPNCTSNASSTITSRISRNCTTCYRSIQWCSCDFFERKLYQQFVSENRQTVLSHLFVQNAKNKKTAKKKKKCGKTLMDMVRSAS